MNNNNNNNNNLSEDGSKSALSLGLSAEFT